MSTSRQLYQADSAITALRAVSSISTAVESTSRAVSKCTLATASTNRMLGIYPGPADAALNDDVEIITEGECFGVAGGTIALYNLLTVDSQGRLIDVSTARILAAQRVIGVAMAAASVNGVFRVLVRPYGYTPGTETDTAANLASVSATINTTNKYAGKAVWVSDAARMVWSGGALASAVWKDGSNSTVYTPV